MNFFRTLSTLALIFGGVPALSAAEADEAMLADHFESKVRPLLLDRCSKCHDGTKNAKSELSVLARAHLIEGGDFGPAIFPGRAEDSLLIQALRRTHKELSMPPEDKGRLTPTEIGVLVKWIDDGAFWPAEEPPNEPTEPGNTSKAIPFDPDLDWALLPRKTVAPPEIFDSNWASNPIDRFVEARRIERNLSAIGTADRSTLIRRITTDLTGLLPSPTEVEQFVSDPDSDIAAFEKVVDRLLASPRYGERQGRLWMDVARYADTQGDVGDYPIPTAYLYRNWVIDAMNRDLGFDEFLRAQLAGDVLATATQDEAAARQLTIATMFVALSRRFGNSKKDAMHLTIEDTLDTIGRGMLGLTLRCARCHDHRFDPVSQRDYYALYGIFESTIYPWMGMSIEKSPSDLSPAIPSATAREETTRFWAQITHYEYQINNHFRPWLKPTLTDYNKISESLKRLEQSSSESAKEEIAALEIRREKLLGFRGGKFRELMLHGLSWLKEEKKRLGSEVGDQQVFAVGEGPPKNARLHRRGNPLNLGPAVPRGYIQVVDGPREAEIQTGSGRLELANWIVDPANPLTARVIVNRIWQQHFGRGLVATPDNFGRQGARPSHPDLLDWLAQRFIDDAWSIKRLHKQIVLSATYRLDSSTESPQQSAIDPENIFLWKHNRRRLDAESIRDCMLAVSGRLDLSQPGAHNIPPWYVKRYGLNGPFHQEITSDHRSVYLLTQRIFRHSQLDLFDGPDRNTSVSRRNSSHVPAQALFLMNSPFVAEQAEALAKRYGVTKLTDKKRIEQMFESLFSRKPTTSEHRDILRFLGDHRKASGNEAETWAALSRTLLASNEFFFID